MIAGRLSGIYRKAKDRNGNHYSFRFAPITS